MKEYFNPFNNKKSSSNNLDILMCVSYCSNSEKNKRM